MNFITGLLILTNWKKESYNFIFVIINQFTKMVYYKSIKITINTLELSEVIFDVVI